MRIDELSVAMALGVAAGGFSFVALSGAVRSGAARRALGVATFSVGATASLWLYAHPAALNQAAQLVSDKAVAIVVAALLVAAVTWRFRSL
jgi:hypothetical protein